MLRVFLSYSDFLLLNNDAEALTTTQYYGMAGVAINSVIQIQNDLFNIGDFGCISRAVKHEIYHIFQAIDYGFGNVSDNAREYDAYFLTLFRFDNLKRVEDNKFG